MMTGDNRLVYAKAKDKIEATKEFEAAVGENKAAALQEQVTGDSQSPSEPREYVTNWRISLQDFPRFDSSPWNSQDQDSCTSTDAFP
jgi:hypothetical protein